jgi:hypothetical protein
MKKKDIFYAEDIILPNRDGLTKDNSADADHPCDVIMGHEQGRRPS